MAKFVAKLKTGRGRLAVLVEHLKCDLASRFAIEEQIDLVSKAEILCSLANVEAELGIAFAGVAAVKLDDAIFQGQAAERLGERLGVVNGQAKPTIHDLILRRACEWLSVWAARAKLRSDTGFVVHLDQKAAPALLEQFTLGWTGFHLHP